MRIGILSAKQALSDTPYRHAPKRVVKVFVADHKLVMLSKSLAQEIRLIPSSDYDRLLHPEIKVIQKLLPPTPPSNLDLYYPNPRYFVKDCGLLHNPVQS